MMKKKIVKYRKIQKKNYHYYTKNFLHEKKIYQKISFLGPFVFDGFSLFLSLSLTIKMLSKFLHVTLKKKLKINEKIVARIFPNRMIFEIEISYQKNRVWDSINFFLFAPIQ